MNIVVPESAKKWIVLHRTELAEEADLESAYTQSLAADLADIVSEIGKVKTILDIGCGMCGIDVLLAKRYGCELLLLDSDGSAENWRGGFEKTMLPFSSRAAANELLEANGVSGYRWLDVGMNESLTADAAISLLSMGHHYPANTYTVDADVLIMDIRIGTDGIERMKRPYKILRTTPKSWRTAFYR
jgi:hypothetical protein